jgi:hypothetical protein
MRDDLGMQEEREEHRRADRIRSGTGQKEATSPLAELTEIKAESEPDSDHNQERKRI